MTVEVSESIILPSSSEGPVSAHGQVAVALGSAVRVFDGATLAPIAVVKPTVRAMAVPLSLPYSNMVAVFRQYFPSVCLTTFVNIN